MGAAWAWHGRGIATLTAAVSLQKLKELYQGGLDLIVHVAYHLDVHVDARVVDQAAALLRHEDHQRHVQLALRQCSPQAGDGSRLIPVASALHARIRLHAQLTRTGASVPQ